MRASNIGSPFVLSVRPYWMRRPAITLKPTILRLSWCKPTRSNPRNSFAFRPLRMPDGTGRLQTVERDVNPLYWNLIRRFGDITGVPILLNTSFNENEPIVNTPAQAIDCFLRTDMDSLAIGSFLLLKRANQHLSGKRGVMTAAVGSQTVTT